MTEDENLKAMETCPRFSGCNAPKCVMDYWMKERVAGGDTCPYLQVIGGMRMSSELLKVVPERNKSHIAHQIKWASKKRLKQA